MSEIVAGFEERAAARAFVYQLAHTVFSGEPSEALFDALASDACRETLAGIAHAADAEDAETCRMQPVAALAAYCNSLAGGGAEARTAELEAAKAAFNRAIAGLGANRSSYPWESAYTNNRRLLFHEETLAVRNAYRAFGYIPEMYPKVADDHIALECAFLAALAGKMAALRAEGDAEELARVAGGQRDFLEKHLLVWIAPYAADLEKDAPGSLYALAAAALAAFAAQDAAFLDACCMGSVQ